ncbi:MAG: kelch repeat-containing protein [Chitinophagaceae bacterium]
MKKERCIFFFLVAQFCFLGISLGQTDQWIQKNATGANQLTGDPVTARYGGICFTISNKVYIGSGINPDGITIRYQTDFWEYDPVNNSWIRKADIPFKRRNAAYFSIGGKGYAGTGYDGNYKNDFWEYDPANDSWKRIANFPGAARSEAVGFAVGDKGYVGSGRIISLGFNDFWEYDPTTNSWNKKPDFPGIYRSWNFGFSIGNKGYTGSGFINSNQTNEFWEYDQAMDLWNSRSDFPGGVREWAVGFSIDTKGYIGSGFNGITASNDFWEYNSISDSWTQRASIAGPGRYGATGFSINGKGYISSGTDGVIINNELWQYNPIGIKPEITSVNPTKVCEGDTVSLFGNNLSGITSIFIANKKISYFKEVSANKILVVVNSNVSGIISISTPAGTATYNGITVFASPDIQFNPDTLFFNGLTGVDLIPLVNGAIDSFAWSPASLLVDPFILNATTKSLSTATTFTLKAKNLAGCTSVGKITVLVPKLIQIPNAFSPNGDGHNEVFRIPIGIIHTLKEMSIYNRWGNIIFRSTDSAKSWDGTIKGRKADAGLYVYVIKAIYEGKEIILKGNLMLVR